MDSNYSHGVPWDSARASSNLSDRPTDRRFSSLDYLASNSFLITATFAYAGLTNSILRLQVTRNYSVLHSIFIVQQQALYVCM